MTNEIKILSEVKNPRGKSNAHQSSSGFCNTGNCNSGDCNSGDYNSGSYNSNNRNSGNCNSGYHNAGSFNSGDYNSGNCNSGHYNSGNCNSGRHNTGHRNSGCYNSGSFNYGDHNSGVFNTDQNPRIKMFDMESSWTLGDWCMSAACRIMYSCPSSHSAFVSAEDMSNEEKEEHPEYTTLSGYVKTVVVTAKDKQEWWDELSEEDKSAVLSLPNFDADKFYLCTEIRV